MPDVEPLNSDGLRFGPLGDRWVHLCIDMQRMFAEDTEWHTPWMERVLPNVVSVVEFNPARTVFTRFIPARSGAEAMGSWQLYYRRWASMTRERLEPELIDLMPALARYAPPAWVEDKTVLSAWHGTLHQRLQYAGVTSLIVTGAETEVCVLATIMGAIDLGYRVVIVTDAVCSGADSTHDAMLAIYSSRFGMQVETINTEQLVAARLDGMLK